MGLESVKHIVLVLSGKGGVGKSTLCAELARQESLGKSVGVLDIDLTGPSIPLLFGVQDAVISQSPCGWLPVQVTPTLKVMSIAFLLASKNDAVIWRGPKKTAMIRQFLKDVHWGDLDVLYIDTPPGTSDEHLSVLEALADHSPDGAILITTPQELSLADVRKELTFCRKLSLHVLGLIENMAGYKCPHCDECSWVFSKGGGQALALAQGIPFLGSVPIVLGKPDLKEIASKLTYQQHL